MGHMVRQERGLSPLRSAWDAIGKLEVKVRSEQQILTEALSWEVKRLLMSHGTHVLPTWQLYFCLRHWSPMRYPGFPATCASRLSLQTHQTCCTRCWCWERPWPARTNAKARGSLRWNGQDLIADNLAENLFEIFAAAYFGKSVGFADHWGNCASFSKLRFPEHTLADCCRAGEMNHKFTYDSTEPENRQEAFSFSVSVQTESCWSLSGLKTFDRVADLVAQCQLRWCSWLQLACNTKFSAVSNPVATACVHHESFIEDASSVCYKPTYTQVVVSWCLHAAR